MSLKVTFTTGRMLEGSVLGVDDVTDIAIVKVNPEARFLQLQLLSTVTADVT